MDGRDERLGHGRCELPRQGKDDATNDSHCTFARSASGRSNALDAMVLWPALSRCRDDALEHVAIPERGLGYFESRDAVALWSLGRLGEPLVAAA